MLHVTEYLKIFIGLLAIVNPLGIVPIFISLTTNQSFKQRCKTTNMVAIGVTTILISALFFGELLLEFFGISIHSFRVGGGILILLMAILMLYAKTSPILQTKEESDESVDMDNVAIVPLAMPLLAGPGGYQHRHPCCTQIHRFFCTTASSCLVLFCGSTGMDFSAPVPVNIQADQRDRIKHFYAHLGFDPACDRYRVHRQWY